MAVAENPKFPSEHSCPGGMMVSEPIDDIVAWSNTLSTWRQDCLRRLALADDLSESDQAELLGMIKQEAGLALAEAQPDRKRTGMGKSGAERESLGESRSNKKKN